MTMLELSFTVLLLAFSVLGLFLKIKPGFYMALFIGANPYIVAVYAAGAALGYKLLQPSSLTLANKKVFILGGLWLGYGSIVSVMNGAGSFISEALQLLLMLFISNAILTSCNERLGLIIVDILYKSGLLLAGLELLAVIVPMDTRAFVGSVAENYTSYVVVLACLPTVLFLRDYKLTRTMVVCCLVLAAVIVNESRGAQLLFIFISGCWLYYSFKKLFWCSVFLAAGVLFVLGFNTLFLNDPNSVFSVLNFESNFSNLERLKLLQVSLATFSENPYGIGIGGSGDIFIENNLTVNQHYPHPHNTLAFLMVELGYVGFIIYVLFFFYLWRGQAEEKHKRFRMYKMSILLSIGFVSIVDVIFYNGLFTLFFWLLFTILVRRFS